ncbi:MAG: carboxypeptidase-like regulatory domain-containing protein [Terracidiphilus sp.]
MNLQKKLYRTLFVPFAAVARVVAVALVVAFAFSPAPASAQIVGGSIGGAIHDSTGAPVSSATVTVRQTDTGFTRTLVTGSDGRYEAPSVPVGPYSVSVAHETFQPQERTGIVLVIGKVSGRISRWA